MSLICSVRTCFSNITTKVDGRRIKFYPFPDEEKLKPLKVEWENICRKICTSVTNENLFRLCELHFEKSYFTEDMQLKPKAIPTIFDDILKRKAERVHQNFNTPAGPPRKRFKAENNSGNEENMSMIVRDNFVTSNPLTNKVEPQELVKIKPQSFNGSPSSVSKSNTVSPQYRLLIQIDKIRAKPGPKCKKLLHSATSENMLKSSDTFKCNPIEISQQTFTEWIKKNLKKSDKQSPDESEKLRLSEIDEETPKTIVQNSLEHSDRDISEKSIQENPKKLLKAKANISKCKNGCELQKIIYNKNPAFQCKKCENIYLLQSDIKSNSTQVNQCLTCKKIFETSELLYSHTKEHLVCDICHCSFKTQFEFKNHIRLHININSNVPFQCHMCDSAFVSAITLRDHVSSTHMTNAKKSDQEIVSRATSTEPYQCKVCDLTIQDEKSYRNHVRSHANNKSILPLVQLRPVNFSCAVCSMKFTTSAEINAHTKIHMGPKTDLEDLRCNICKQIFSDDRILSDHLRDHVARARRCHLCPKAFINKSSLQIHLETHN